MTKLYFKSERLLTMTVDSGMTITHVNFTEMAHDGYAIIPEGYYDDVPLEEVNWSAFDLMIWGLTEKGAAAIAAHFTGHRTESRTDPAALGVPPNNWVIDVYGLRLEVAQWFVAALAEPLGLENPPKPPHCFQAESIAGIRSMKSLQ